MSLNFEDVSFGKANEPIQLSIGGPDIREPELVDLPILSDVQNVTDVSSSELDPPPRTI